MKETRRQRHSIGLSLIPQNNSKAPEQLRSPHAALRFRFLSAFLVLLTSAPLSAQGVTNTTGLDNTISNASANNAAPTAVAGLRTNTGGALASTKLIPDALLLLRPDPNTTDGQALNVSTQATPSGANCEALSQAAEQRGWCGWVSFDVASPVRDKQTTLRVSVGGPIQVSGASQPVTDTLSVALDSSCPATGSGDAIDVTFPAAGGACRIGITTFASEPGEYRLTTRAREVSGAIDQSSTLTVRAQRSVWVALFWLAIGGLVGGLLAYIRTLFRARVAAYGSALRLAQRYDVAAELALRSRLVPQGRASLLDSVVTAYLADAKAGRSDNPVAGQPTLAERVSALNQWAVIAQRATALEATLLTPLAAKFDRALSDVLDGTNPIARLATLETDVDADLDRQAQGLAGLAAEASGVAQAASPVATPDLSTIAFAGVTTLEQLEGRQFLAGLIETLLTFCLFALGALLIIWIENDAWGTTKDVINMILVGAGAFLGAATIKGMREGARV